MTKDDETPVEPRGGQPSGEPADRSSRWSKARASETPGSETTESGAPSHGPAAPGREAGAPRTDRPAGSSDARRESGRDRNQQNRRGGGDDRGNGQRQGRRDNPQRQGGDRRREAGGSAGSGGYGETRSGGNRSGGNRAGASRSGGDRPRGGQVRRDDRSKRSDNPRDRRPDDRGERRPRRTAESGSDRLGASPTNPHRAPRSWDRTSARNRGLERAPRAVEPELPEDVTGHELDRDVWTQLRTLSKENADGVAKHLVASAVALEEDPDRALAHATHAAGRAGRVPAVREALGLVYYRRGEFADALREFRTARRLSGSDHLLPYMVDAERGLGRYERALDLANSPAARTLGEADNIELLIVVSGIRRDLDQGDAAVAVLSIPALRRGAGQPWAARLFYAYADALLAAGRPQEAKEWFAKSAAADTAAATDAQERVDELDGFQLIDLVEDGVEDGDGEGAGATPSADAGPDSADSREHPDQDTANPPQDSSKDRSYDGVQESSAERLDDPPPADASGNPGYDSLRNPFSG